MLEVGLYQEYGKSRETLDGVFISEITRLQNHYDHILTPAIHCISEYLPTDVRDAVFGKLSEVLRKIEPDKTTTSSSSNDLTLKGISLITQYFKSTNIYRQNAIDDALKMNLLNPIISIIYLLNEEQYDFSQYDNNNKIIQVQLGRRMSFSDALAFAHDNLSGDIVAIANSDIYFDDSLVVVLSKNEKLSNTLIALSKWNSDDDGALTLQLRVDSQDAWIFKSPLANESIIDSSNFFLGVPRCDNRIAEIFHASGYRVINPAYSIHAIEIKGNI